MTPRVAISDYQAGLIDADALLRALLGWERWRVRVEAPPGHTDRPRVALLRTPAGSHLLELFSDDEALDAFHAVEGRDPDAVFHEVVGWELLTLLDLESLGRVNFDLHSPHRVYWEHEGLQAVRGWARTLRTEAVLHDPACLPDPLVAFVAHPAWYLLLARDDAASAEHALLLAPDAADRSIAAVFTAADRAREALPEYADRLDGPIEIVSYTTAELVDLLGRMNLDGLVFNPFSDDACRAFRADLLVPLRERLERSRAGAS